MRARVLLLLLAACLAPLLAAADERILDYRSDLNLRDNGQLMVTELIKVRAEGNNIKRGIYRDFPTRYKDRLGNRVNVEFNVLSVRRNGETEPWHTEQRQNGVRLYAGSTSRFIEPGVHEYELTFVTNRQLGFFEHHDELYFNAIGHGWIFPIDRASATVTLPFSVPASQLTLDTYTGAYGATSSDAVADVLADNRVRFEIKRPLQPREGMTIAVAWPKGLIAEPGPLKKAGWFLSDNRAALVLLIGLLAPFGWHLKTWNRIGRDPEKGVIIPRFKPPDGLSPAACRYVLSMSFNRKAFTAAIISLAVKGQLLIKEKKKKEFSLERVPAAPKAELSSGEMAVLDSLLPVPSSRIELDNENHREFQKALNALKGALKKEYFGRLFKLNTTWLLPPVLMSVAAAVIAWFLDGGPAVWIPFVALTLLMHALFAFLMRAPTRGGRLVMDEIEGFGMYLDTAEQDRLDHMRSPALTPEVFENFLPYAYALGVQNNWCQRFARELPEEVTRKSGYNPRWYDGRFRGMNALDHLGDNFGSSFSSAISSASTAPGSSSGSGGGGSSGGGGGGGGGGGW